MSFRRRPSATRFVTSTKFTSENVPSQSACNTRLTNCWMKRSSTVGTPSARRPHPAPSVSPPHRLWPLDAVKQLGADREPELVPRRLFLTEPKAAEWCEETVPADKPGPQACDQD